MAESAVILAGMGRTKDPETGELFDVYTLMARTPEGFYTAIDPFDDGGPDSYPRYTLETGTARLVELASMDTRVCVSEAQYDAMREAVLRRSKAQDTVQ